MHVGSAGAGRRARWRSNWMGSRWVMRGRQAHSLEIAPLCLLCRREKRTLAQRLEREKKAAAEACKTLDAKVSGPGMLDEQMNAAVGSPSFPSFFTPTYSLLHGRADKRRSGGADECGGGWALRFCFPSCLGIAVSAVQHLP